MPRTSGMMRLDSFFSSAQGTKVCDMRRAAELVKGRVDVLAERRRERMPALLAEKRTGISES